MLEEAIQLIQNKQYEKAKSILLKLAAEQPNETKVNFYCAESHDALGLEREAIPYYETAIENGIDGELREKAYIQLGSSYRCVGEYESAASVLQRGLEEFPENLAMQTFLAMALYNLKHEEKAVALMLNIVADSSNDPWVKRYIGAIKFYSKNINETW